MANRLHSDVAVTCAHWPGMSPSAYSLSLASNTALGPGEDRLAPSFLLPAVSCLFTSCCLHLKWHYAHSTMQGMGLFSLPTLVSSPGSVLSSATWCPPGAPTFSAALYFLLSHALSLKQYMLKSVKIFLCPLIHFSGGFGLFLLWPEHIQQSTQQPVSRGISRLPCHLPAGAITGNQVSSTWLSITLYGARPRPREAVQPHPPPLELSSHWLSQKHRGGGTNNLTEEQEAHLMTASPPKLILSLHSLEPERLRFAFPWPFVSLLYAALAASRLSPAQQLLSQKAEGGRAVWWKAAEMYFLMRKWSVFHCGMITFFLKFSKKRGNKKRNVFICCNWSLWNEVFLRKLPNIHFKEYGHFGIQIL